MYLTFQRGIFSFLYEHRKFSGLNGVDFSFFRTKGWLSFTNVWLGMVRGESSFQYLNRRAFCVLEVCLLLCKWVGEIKEIFIQLNWMLWSFHWILSYSRSCFKYNIIYILYIYIWMLWDKLMLKLLPLELGCSPSQSLWSRCLEKNDTLDLGT